jgi:hypothetical protein
MDKTQLTPEQQIAWAQGKLVTSVFLRDVAGCHAAWKVLGNTEISLCIANLIRNGVIV